MSHTNEQETLRVSKIKNGTVIDHIPAGRALAVLRLLGITGGEGHVITVTMNVKSGKLGKKDLVKVEDLELMAEQVNKLTLIAPTATINIIRNYEVVEKRAVKLPDRITGILRCTNPGCITRQPMEHVSSKFIVVSKTPLRLECEYCGRYLEEEEVLKQLTQ